jgi:Na+-translocating ferredoxin:NAD+ oxidoreductase RnfG subunit
VNTEQREVSLMEQHIGTVLQIMVIALLSWSLTTTVNLRTDVSILQSQLQAVTASLNQALNDRYVIASLRSDIVNLERRCSELEKRR